MPVLLRQPVPEVKQVLENLLLAEPVLIEGGLLSLFNKLGKGYQPIAKRLLPEINMIGSTLEGQIRENHLAIRTRGTRAVETENSRNLIKAMVEILLPESMVERVITSDEIALGATRLEAARTALKALLEEKLPHLEEKTRDKISAARTGR